MLCVGVRSVQDVRPHPRASYTGFNFSPEPQWDNKQARMQRVVTFMQQRHYLALARQHDEVDLAKKITGELFLSSQSGEIQA